MKTLYVLTVAVLMGAPALWADAVIRSGDTFEIKLGGVPSDDAGQISTSYTVDGEGKLNLAYVGKVQAAGLTPSQIQSEVENTYIERGIFTHPTVTVNIAPTARMISVMGEVNQRGRVAYTPDMTIMSAIAAAGDFTIYANPAQVRLIRGTTIKVLNCKKIRSNPSMDEKVLPGDRLEVPQAFF